MTFRKYFGEEGGPQHGSQKLHWPGTLEGFPVAASGSVPDLKKEELENLELRYDFKSKMFKLWLEPEKAEFDDINDKIVNGWYRLLKRSDHWSEDQSHYIVWLEWCQVYGMLPPKS